MASNTRRTFLTGSLLALGSATLPFHRASAQAAATSSNRARLLTHDGTSLLHRLQLIESASREVLISAYEVGDDRIALRILATLRAAARRGVDVRLMVDGHGQNNLIPKAMMQHLIDEGVQLREHMPDARYKLEIGRQRMHDKLLVVDGDSLIIGGRNVRADYYGLADADWIDKEKAKKNRLDRELFVRGPVVCHAHAYFHARWDAGTTGQPTLDRKEKHNTDEAQQLSWLNDMPRQRAVRCAAQLLDEAYTAELHLPDCTCHMHSLDCVCESYFELPCVRFLHDLPEQPKDHPAAIACQLNRVISAAQHCIFLESPYLVFSRNLCSRLIEASERGVSVCILTNSLETTDRVIAQAQYINERGRLRAAGIEMWELTGDRHLHAKSMVVDHHLAMIGSYNFDVLSETRNSEVAVLIDDVSFTAALTHQMIHHLMRAEPVPMEGSLVGYDAKTHDIDPKLLREARLKRLITPFIKKYL